MYAHSASTLIKTIFRKMPFSQLISLRSELSATQSEVRERQESYQRNMAVLTSKLREVANAREEARRAMDAKQKEQTVDGGRENMERQMQVYLAKARCSMTPGLSVDKSQ